MVPDHGAVALPQAVSAAVAETEANLGPLPPMDDLVQRIPEVARDLIEELFRARFVTVKRIAKKSLKS